jgi:phosphoglycolate phosphatase
MELMYPVDLIIFDVDGTLVDSAHDLIVSVNYTLEAIGLPREDPAMIQSFIGDGVRKLVERSLGSEYQHLYLKAVEVFRAHYNEHLLDHTRLYPGTEDVLAHFSHKKKAVLTNKSYGFTVKILQGLNILHNFEEVVGADSTPYLKPEPYAIFRIIEDLRARSERTVMIGDGVKDIEAAKSAGVKSCGVLYGYTNRERLLNVSPDFLCEKIQDLKEILF